MGDTPGDKIQKVSPIALTPSSAQTRADPYKTIHPWEILAQRGSQTDFLTHTSGTTGRGNQ